MARPDQPTDFHPHPHLRLLVPSSTPTIHLEARLYLPTPLPPSVRAHANVLGEYSTVPQKLENLHTGLRNALQDMGVQRVVVASHPWGRLGGDMLDPVISSHLISAIYHPYHSTTTDPSSIEGSNPNPASMTDTSGAPNPAELSGRTAVMSYNVRGVGLSEGSQPWTGIGADPDDFVEVEKIGVALMGDSVKEVLRYGYSWGTLLATLAPHPGTYSIPLIKTLLVSPPVTAIKALTLLSSKKFPASVTSLATAQKSPVWIVYGTKDEFTATSTMAHFVQEMASSVKGFEVEDADHLWRRDEGEKLREIVRNWLDS
ncbi:hypothetical protein IAU60_002145 [Kwoniella sp. DSM 27419]